MLEQILETKKQELESFVMPEDADVQRVSFYKALRNPNRGLALISEVKKASPSKGVIKEKFAPTEVAAGYESGGADALSVLTDQTYFQGKREFVSDIKRQVGLPILRKDFIIDPRQVEESRRIGADAILLIVAALEIEELYELYQLATDKGLDCLVEVHSEQELKSLLNVFTPKIIGVNNRDLKVFKTSLSQSERLSGMIPEEALFISESGISTNEDMKKVKSFGADGVLIGEALMRAETPEEGIQMLFKDEVE
ncbi:MAG TPA: indole-3-glycerol phosphate synthase TrpC [Bacillales bacterium]|nr:indole-3-glycerol phosphate synthase TrpC [Bacillales bacterium]